MAVLDPFRGPSGPYNFRKDTSHLLLLELSRRGHRILYTDPARLVASSGGLSCLAQAVDLLDSDPYFLFHEEKEWPLSDLSLILMRKDPPVDSLYLQATQILSLIADQVPVVNNPRALRDLNEKLAILNFPKWIPSTLVTSSRDEIDSFATGHGGTLILKELDSFAGKGVQKVSRGEACFGETVDTLTLGGNRLIMAQPFLPAVSEGEKRVFMIDGIARGALLKIPPEGGFQTNPDLGGRLAPARLTPREKGICRQVGSFLKKHDIFFAGLDLIGGQLTEINITSPGLVWEWNEVDRTDHGPEIAQLLERRMR